MNFSIATLVPFLFINPRASNDDPLLADFFVRQTFLAIERGQTFHHRLDKVCVGVKKLVERLPHELFRAPSVASSELDEAGFLFRCQLHLH